MQRRDFLKATTTAIAGATLAPRTLAASSPLPADPAREGRLVLPLNRNWRYSKSVMKNRVPLVTMDRRLVGPGLSDVSVDSSSGMRQAVGHLHKLGHRRIAYIGGSAGATISDHRLRSFVRAMERLGLVVDPQLLREGNYRINGGEAAMAELLELRAPLTAIIAANDLTAIGLCASFTAGGFPCLAISLSWVLTTSN